MQRYGFIGAVAAAALSLFGLPGAAQAQDSLTVVSWGGVYQDAERFALYQPTAKEMGNLSAILAEEKDDKRVLEDVFWALLNTEEFVFNH